MSNGVLEAARLEFQAAWIATGTNLDDTGKRMLEHIFSWTAGYAIARDPRVWLPLKDSALRRLGYVEHLIHLIPDASLTLNGNDLKWLTDFVVLFYQSPDCRPELIKVCEGYPLNDVEVANRDEWAEAQRLLGNLPDPT
ncbi:MAG TPA: hypothetical protein VFX98_08705 [Longimicrobiaceae bacterium]|nr:hypothetical protein [Longimicrobiaceae bacterium]